MAAAGLNAIQTYVAWNGHEQVPGVYDFTGRQDIEKFLQIAQSYNLSVILRPGPYICAEWEFGGLPAWLLNTPNIQLRTMDENYIQAVDKWFTKLYTIIKPHLFKNGGPIITVQVENEYGSYFACDNKYLQFLRDKARTMLGEDVVLFTTDGDGDGYLKCGTVEGAYATVDFGITNDPSKNFEIQRHKEPKGPLVNSEYYTGWLDHWGEKHSTTDKSYVANSLDKMLALGANVNMYMFEGGTNFEFWNGAEYKPYRANPTSYDYDAPLSEAGDITAKYLLLRKVISKYRPLQDIPIPPNTSKKAYGRIKMSLVETVHTYAASVTNVTSVYPLNMEKINCFYGFILYQHVLKENVINGTLDLTGVRDRAYVSVVSEPFPMRVGIVERESKNTTLQLTGKQGDVLSILVENQGRINYGSQINNNRKGLTTNVTLNGQILTDWVHTPVDLYRQKSSLTQRMYTKPGVGNAFSVPSIYKGLLLIEDEPEDTYIDMSIWTKGQVYVNGQNMGRYWPQKGPQVRLYIPKFALREGTNNILLLELEMSPCEEEVACFVDFKDTPLIDGNVTAIHDKMNYGFHDKVDEQKSISFFQILVQFVVQFWEKIIFFFL